MLQLTIYLMNSKKLIPPHPVKSGTAHYFYHTLKTQPETVRQEREIKDIGIRKEELNYL